MEGGDKFERDAQALRKAMEGGGTDEETIVKITGNRTNEERQKIIKYYKSSFGRDLLQDLDDEISGNFGKVIYGMYLTPPEYDAHELYKAMKGIGTDEDTLIEILASRSNKRLPEIKEAFQKKYKKSLEEEIKDETSGDLRNLLVSILQCNRNESNEIDMQKIRKDCKDLYDAGENKWGTDESVFNRIFALRNPMELSLINKHYPEVSGNTLEKAIDSEFSGDIKKLLQSILFALTKPSYYFATRINKAVKGWGTNDNLLIRILVSRDEVDLEDIKKAYEQLYGVQLLAAIDDETSGDYKSILMELASH